ncbi:MAG: M3 family oligoendopeptidase [Lewinellaceae bacterium]|nr:M3 family oligoendopeptidase [Lewinellaceae bacterium]
MKDLNVVSRGSNVFIAKTFTFESWDDLLPYYQDLLDRDVESLSALEAWIHDKSELDACISEAFSWRYIAMSCNSEDQAAVEAYHQLVRDVSPQVASFEHLLNEKLVGNAHVEQLPEERYRIYLRNVRNSVSLFHSENVPVYTAVQLKSKEYGRIFSQMTIGVDGKQMTLQKATTLLEETDRDRRQQVYHKINQRILQDTEQLEDLFDELLAKRHRIALNSGFDNYRDYAFRALGRFDYTVDDCLNFHDSIVSEILPILDEFNTCRQKMLGTEPLRPWDLNIDPSGCNPLRPFSHVDELLDTGLVCLNRVDPLFAEVIGKMRKMGRLDLDSRPGKRPGGYNMPLQVSGVPFIFMNATQSMNDLRTFMHECGHAIHFYLNRDRSLLADRRFPSEISELAAMSMELLTMDYWDTFFPGKDDLRRARMYQLEMVLKVLPWIATIDKFQHWVYTHPNHSREERKEAWMTILRSFLSPLVDYSGLDHYLEYLWHKQLHIFEVPFYYIEYGFAQLGAIAIWRRFREEGATAVQDYIGALQLGHTRSVADVYAAAGIRFDFSQEYVGKIGQFVHTELQSLMD